MVEVKVRSPTGRAWVLFIVGFIAAGELLFEVQKSEPAELFRMPLTDAELVPWIVLSALAAAVGLAWLVRLYAFPGQLVFDIDAGVVRRLQQRMLRTRTVEAPAGDWRVRVSFFDAEHRDRGVFKRAELRGPGFHEVLLFTDCRPGDGFMRGVEAMDGRLRLEVELERDRPAGPERS